MSGKIDQPIDDTGGYLSDYAGGYGIDDLSTALGLNLLWAHEGRQFPVAAYTSLHGYLHPLAQDVISVLRATGLDEEIEKRASGCDIYARWSIGSATWAKNPAKRRPLPDMPYDLRHFHRVFLPRLMHPRLSYVKSQKGNEPLWSLAASSYADFMPCGFSFDESGSDSSDTEGWDLDDIDWGSDSDSDFDSDSDPDIHVGDGSYEYEYHWEDIDGVDDDVDASLTSSARFYVSPNNAIGFYATKAKGTTDYSEVSVDDGPPVYPYPSPGTSSGRLDTPYVDASFGILRKDIQCEYVRQSRQRVHGSVNYDTGGTVHASYEDPGVPTITEHSKEKDIREAFDKKPLRVNLSINLPGTASALPGVSDDTPPNRVHDLPGRNHVQGVYWYGMHPERYFERMFANAKAAAVVLELTAAWQKSINHDSTYDTDRGS